LIELDGARLGGGQALRQSLTLSALSGQPFHLRQIRTGQPRPGLHPDQTAEVRAAALCCEARLVGAFDGSTDLRFEPGAPAAGEYHIELPGAASAAQVAQMLVPILAAAPEPSRVTIVGGTHVPRAPLHEAVAGPWLAGLAAVGLRASARLVGIGFHPAGGGQVALAVEGWTRPAAFDWGRRGELMSLRGVSVGSRLRGEVGQRQREGCARHLWEQRRLEVAWDVVTARSTSPGAYLHVEAVFEHSRASFGLLGQRGVAPEALGQRLARRILRFLDLEGAPASDTFTAEQSLVPLALAGGGGRLTTPEIGLHLEQAVELLRLFGRAVRLTGRRGGPGEVEVDA
jgi:RNA 3'-terminal phosphate cyclase (ATP)